MDYTQKGKRLSYLLRHMEGFTDSHGWAEVEKVMKELRINQATLLEIVRTDNKQRYKLSEDGMRIRANQGHTVKVDVELKTVIPPQVLYHGTGDKFTASIERTGLDKRKRLHVHLSKDIDTARKVGMRHGEPVIYRINSGKMYNDGFIFYLSENGVYLVNDVPIKYLERL